MSATLERQAEESLHVASTVEAAFRVIERDRREARVCFIRDAKAAGWAWTRMGRALGISDAAVRRFWRDNRMSSTRLGDGNATERLPLAAPAARNGRTDQTAG